MEPQDSDLLLPFEQRNLSGDYRVYYIAKRNNFFATVQDFSEMWTFFCKIDEIWKRDLADLEVIHDFDRHLPLALYFNAHAKVRVSMELAFSQCMQEARSVLRDAVECVAHAITCFATPQIFTRGRRRINRVGTNPSKQRSRPTRRRCFFKASRSCMKSTVNFLRLDRTQRGRPSATD